jgi:mannose-6-phosphate isomerase-like protein (cupin superfamily)
MISQFNIDEKFELITAYWTPKIVGELNGQYIKLAKIKGDFIWHRHDNEDELFMVRKGTLIVDFRDKTTYTKTGEILIIPKGIEHKPRTDGEEVWIVLFEPKATKHTGETEHENTVKNLEWI